MKATRRNFIKQLGLASATFAGSKAIAETCGVLTPEQDQGPFYPENDQADKDNNLVWVQGKKDKALGEVIQLDGAILDSKTCKPIDGVLIEIWQACESGRYNHSGDPNTKAKLDPNFQYWGKAITDAEGKFSFITIRPGQYPATPTWDRPAHIHVKILKRGYRDLTTQLYFSDDSLNTSDRIYMSMSEEERESVTIDYQPKKNSNDIDKFGSVELKIEPV